MSHPGGDRIKELSNTSGTGSFVLTGAVSGEPVQAFSSAEDGKAIRYVAKHITALEGESGLGIYTHSTRTLTRLYRYAPTEGGAAVSFSAGGVHVSPTPTTFDIVPNEATVDPTGSDDINAGYLRGMEWINTATPSVWKCSDHGVWGTPGSAVWVRLDGAGSGHTIQSDGAAQTSRANLDFLNGVVTDDAGNNATKVNVGFIASTGFDPTAVLVDDNRLYTDVYNQTGTVSVAKSGSGTFRHGKTIWVLWNSNGDAISWSADCEGMTGSLPSFLPVGEHWLAFTWHSGKSKILVASNTTFGLLAGVILVDYSESTASQTGVTGALTLDYHAGQKQTVTFGAGNITSVTISNWPASGEFGSLTVDYVQDGVGGRTLADPANSAWFGGTPTYDTGAGARNRVTYTTEDAGASVLNHYAGAL